MPCARRSGGAACACKEEACKRLEGGGAPKARQAQPRSTRIHTNKERRAVIGGVRMPRQPPVHRPHGAGVGGSRWGMGDWG